jgi:exopolysaccharide production protein ExoY
LGNLWAFFSRFVAILQTSPSISIDVTLCVATHHLYDAPFDVHPFDVHRFDIVAFDIVASAIRLLTWSCAMSDSVKTTDLSFSQVDTEFEPVLGGFIKRGFDIVGALAGLVALSPLFLLVALLVKFSDGGSVFYGHRRIGRGGSIFHCLKFRTMVEDGDVVLANYFGTNPEAKEEWEATRKLREDPRVTRVGAVLRKLSLDELPQIVNILQGHMSIVGPRPVVRDELENYGNAAVFYLKSRPGLTGLWQISGRNDISYATRVAFDRHYIENWSLKLDLHIIIKTVPAVCMAKGSY